MMTLKFPLPVVIVSLQLHARSIDRAVNQGLHHRQAQIMSKNLNSFHVNLDANANEESWHKITTKDKVYNECIKQNFHFDEDSEGTIKKNILKSIGKSCKDTKLRSYDAYYDPTSTTKQNIENRPSRINREDWRWYLDYRSKSETQVI
ncbi:hypothetical protein AHAS_Ahas04G0109400 [Arachis hypogaea]